MNKISSSKRNASVKFVFNSFCALTLAMPSVALAQTPPAGGYNSKDEIADRQAQRRQEACKEARRQITDAEKAIGEACRKAGLGEASSCIAKAESCGETLGTESFTTTDAIATVMGLPADANIGGSCPQMNGRNYYDEKKRLQDEIKDLEKEIAELGDDKADIEETFNTTIQDLQQGLTDAQQELEEVKEKLSEEEREKIAEFQSSQNAAKEQLRERNSKILSLRGALTQAIRKKATKMLELTSETSKFTCTAEYRKAAEAYGKVSSTSSSSHMRNAKNQKAVAIDAFNKCMDRFLQARIQLNEDSQIEQDNINDQIASTQSSIDELNDSLSLASTQLDEMKKATETKKTNAQKKVTDLMTLTQQKMTAAQQTMQTKLQTLATKQSSLTAALNRANNSMLTLGPAPDRGTEYTSKEASSEISSQVGIIENLVNDAELKSQNCSLNSQLLSSKSKNRSSRTSSSTKGRR